MPPHFTTRGRPDDGMEKSYQEILRLLSRLGVSAESFVLRGSTGYLPDWDNPIQSEAAADLIQRAATADSDPLYVVAIGAITNVACAILLEPEIIRRIVVVWLGGQPLHWPSAREFNLEQDPEAARVILDSGVPLVQIPCSGVASHLLTTVAEIERYVAGQGAIGDYLAEIFKGYHDDHFGWSKVIWDISTIGYLLNPSWVPTEIVHSPILTEQITWSFDRARHFVRFATYVECDPHLSRSVCEVGESVARSLKPTGGSSAVRGPGQSEVEEAPRLSPCSLSTSPHSAATGAT